MPYVRLGTITKTFGLHGQVLVKSLTSFASIRFKRGAKISLFDEKTAERKELSVNFFRDSGDYFYLGFEEIDNMDKALELVGKHLEMEKEAAFLPEGYYRLSDLIGSKVLDAKDGKKIGEVIDVNDFCPTANLKIRKEDGKNFYVPLVMKEFIEKIDIESKTIHINLIEGLL